MKNADIFINQNDSEFNIKVEGRATFAVGPMFRKLVDEIVDDSEIKMINIDLSECTGMDSTYMGIVAMLALHFIKKQIKINILNAGINKQLLDGLGLNKLFNYLEKDNSSLKWKLLVPEEKENDVSAETVLEAHKVLMKADSGNVEKFKNVVEMVEKDLKQ